MSERWKPSAVTWPSGITSMWAVTALRSSPGRSEQMSLESRSGSMGSTVPGRYTEHPRRSASRSIAPPAGT